MLVLIAEDDVIPRTTLKLAIEQFGHCCLVAEDGLQAWEMYQKNPVNVIISDRMMPEMDGIELCHQVRASMGGGYTYFIFLTALAEKAQLLDGINAGADDYLTKPFNPEELRTRLLVASRVTGLHQELAEKRAELERLNKELFEQGRLDPLTHLGNRLRLMEDLNVLYDHAVRYNKSYCAVMCDVDYFKSYNDYYGHLAGDEVLRQIARVIAQNCRAGDSAYRYGGEEFLILLPEQMPDKAAIAAERLRAAIEALDIPHVSKTPPGVVTLSAGIAALDLRDYQAVHLWLKRADEALYRAKQAGRNRVSR